MSRIDEHDCLDHLHYRCAEHVETHGLDCPPYEHWWEEWYTCAICGEDYDERDVKVMAEADE